MSEWFGHDIALGWACGLALAGGALAALCQVTLLRWQMTRFRKGRMGWLDVVAGFWVRTLLSVCCLWVASGGAAPMLLVGMAAYGAARLAFVRRMALALAPQQIRRPEGRTTDETAGLKIGQITGQTTGDRSGRR